MTVFSASALQLELTLVRSAIFRAIRRLISRSRSLFSSMKFDHLKSKKLQDHLEALQSRCHFLDLTLDTMRDKFLRIKQIFLKGDLFQDYDLTQEQSEEILEFMDQKKDQLREMSLRMALKIADLIKISPNWRAMAENTVMKNDR